MQSTFSITRTVEFHETDMAGMVHFANFFKYFEVAEAEYFRSIGASIFDEAVNLRWPRVHASCDFKGPLRFGDVFKIELRVKAVTAKTVELEFIVGKSQDGGSAIAAIGRVVNVCAYYDVLAGRIRSQPIPEALRAALRVAVVQTDGVAE